MSTKKPQFFKLSEDVISAIDQAAKDMKVGKTAAVEAIVRMYAQHQISNRPFSSKQLEESKLAFKSNVGLDIDPATLFQPEKALQSIPLQP